MVREIMKDTAFLSQKAEIAVAEDVSVARDLLETLEAHRDGCAGMAAGRNGDEVMTDDFKEFLELPGTPQEQEWLKEQLETLSVRESYALAAVSMGYPPEKAADAINSILHLPDCTLHPAGSYEDLGKRRRRRAFRPLTAHSRLCSVAGGDGGYTTRAPL